MRYRLWIRSLAANLALHVRSVREMLGDDYVLRLFRNGIDPLTAADQILGNR